MSDTVVGDTKARLKSFVTRIEALSEELKKTKEDIKEVYNEAKGEGFDTKALAKVIRLLQKSREERDQEQALLDTYLHALEN